MQATVGSGHSFPPDDAGPTRNALFHRLRPFTTGACSLCLLWARSAFRPLSPGHQNEQASYAQTLITITASTVNSVSYAQTFPYFGPAGIGFPSGSLQPHHRKSNRLHTPGLSGIGFPKETLQPHFRKCRCLHTSGPSGISFPGETFQPRLRKCRHLHTSGLSGVGFLRESLQS